MYKHKIDYGYGTAILINDKQGDEAIKDFYHKANQCFGIRKSITKEPEIEETQEVQDITGALFHNGDSILFDAENNKVLDEFETI